MTGRCPTCGGVVVTRHPLSKKQAEVYRYVATFIHQNGYAPNFDEIAEHFGFKSLASVHEHLANLERKGWVNRSYNQSRSITCLVPVDEMGDQATTAAVSV